MVNGVSDCGVWVTMGVGLWAQLCTVCVLGMCWAHAPCSTMLYRKKIKKH
jgi:hypothetical protein